jgi:hypothetical protein
MVGVKSIKTFLGGGNNIAREVIECISRQIRYCWTILALAK